MVEFYNRYIRPQSPLRSKLSVHLNAQSAAPSPSIAATVIDLAKENIVPAGINGSKFVEHLSPVAKAPHEAPVEIVDVRGFKAQLRVSAGPKPVKDITTFEDLDAKL